MLLKNLEAPLGGVGMSRKNCTTTGMGLMGSGSRGRARIPRAIFAACFAAAAIVASGQAQAANNTWSTSSTAAGTYTWSTIGNWAFQTSVPNGQGEIAAFNSTARGQLSINVDSPITLAMLTWVGGSASISGTNVSQSMTFTGAAITIDNGASSGTIWRQNVGGTTADAVQNNLILNSDLLLRNDIGTAGGISTLSGTISGGKGVTVRSGVAAWLLSNAANSYTGKTTVNQGNLRFASISNVGGGNSALGNPTLASSTIALGFSGDAGFLYAGATTGTTDRVIELVNSGSQTFNFGVISGGGKVAFTSPINPSGGGRAVLTFGQNATGTWSHSGVIAGSNVSVLLGQTTGGQSVELLGLNTYSGSTVLRRGTFVVNSMADAGSASSLGAPTGADAIIAISPTGSGTNAILQYIGTGHSSNRPFLVRDTTASFAAIEANGAGKLTLSGSLSAIADPAFRHYSLGGTGQGEVTGTIQGATVGLVKGGVGTWTLSAANTYGGTTSISGGVLRVGSGGLPSAGTLVLGSGTLASTGGSLTLSNPLATLAGNPGFTGSESISVSGTLPLGASRTITNSITGAGKSLTLGGITTAGAAATTVTIDGSGSTSLGPLLQVGTGTIMNLRGVSVGTTKLTGANTLTGTVAANMGTLIADFGTSTNATNKLGAAFHFGTVGSPDSSVMGADLVISGNSSTGTVSVAGLRFNGPSSKILSYSVRRDSSTSVLAVTGSMTSVSNSRFFMDIEPGAVVVTGTTGMQANSIFRSMTVGNDWATLSGSTTGAFQALGTYVNFPTTGNVSGTNYLLAGNGSYGGNNTVANSLKIVNSGDDQTFSVTGTLSTLSLLYAGGNNSNYTISGNGAYNAGANTYYWIVKTGTLTMDVATTSPNMVFAKSGTGRLHWNSAHASGTMSAFITQGVMRLGNSLATGTLADLDIIFSPAGSALELVGNIAIPSGKTHNIAGRGVADGGAVRNVSGTNSMAGRITLGGLSGTPLETRINADSGSQLTLTGGIVTASRLDVIFGGAGNVIVETGSISGAGNLTKDGAGRLELRSNNTYTGLTTVSAGELKVNGQIAASTAGLTNGFYVAAGATVSGTGTINTQAYFDGTLAPGNSAGTITYTQDVVWSGSSAWNFELSGTGAGQYDQVLITSGGSFYRDTSIAGSDAAGYYKFNFLGTGTVGTFRLVDWSGTTNFVNANFSALNLGPNLTGTFNVDNTESALFYTVSSLGPLSANYTLAAGVGSSVIYAGGSTLVTGTLGNTGPDGGDVIGFTGFSGTGSFGSFSLSPASGTVASNSVTTGTGSFTSNTPGLYTITPAVTSATNVVLTTNATLTSTGTTAVNVLAHTNPTLSLISGSGQTVFAGGTFSPVSYSISNPGSNVSALTVQSLSNLSGGTGTSAVATASTGTYTATLPSTASPGSGFQVVSAQAGDTQTINGADPLTTLSGSFAYTVLAHTSPTLSIITGGGQTIITGGTFTPISYSLSNPGSNVSALDVQSLSNLSGATGGAVVAAGATGTYSATAPSNVTVTAGNQLVSLQAGDDQTINGANPLQTLGGTFAYTVLDHSIGSLSGAGTALTGTISLGVWDWDLNSWVQGTGSSTYALYNLATTSPSLTAALDVSGTSIGGDAGFSTNFDLAGYSLIGGGSSSSFLAMYDTTASGTVSGTYTATFTFVTRDQQNLSGATAGNTLVLTAKVVVVPEPATIALAGLGAGLAGLLAYRRRKSQKRAA